MAMGKLHEGTAFGHGFSRPAVMVIILNWNGVDDTIRCLESTLLIDWDPFEIVVVDNGSTDDSVEQIRLKFPKVKLIENGSNLGYAEGNNVGFRYGLKAGADFLLALNNDTICEPTLIASLVEAADCLPDGGVFCPRICYMSHPDRVWFDGARWNRSLLSFDFPGQDRLESELGADVHESAYACGAAFFVRAELVERLGGFDPRFFLVWEESDFCYRARKLGWRSYVVPSAKILHRVGASFGTEAAPLRTYFSSRNRLFWLSRHGSLSERARSFAICFRALVPGLYWTRSQGVGLFRGGWWALSEWIRSLCGGGRSVQFLSKRRAAIDFLCGRFGPPPDCILQFNRAWIVAKRD